jgi:hypothetical protein
VYIDSGEGVKVKTVKVCHLGPINLILGPIVAPNVETASLLIDKLAQHHQGKARIDVPSGKEELMSFFWAKLVLKR